MARHGPLLWRHNGRDDVSNHQPRDCLVNRLFGRGSKKTSKLRVTGLCAGNAQVTDEFPTRRASNAENASIWWKSESYLCFLCRPTLERLWFCLDLFCYTQFSYTLIWMSLDFLEGKTIWIRRCSWGLSGARQTIDPDNRVMALGSGYFRQYISISKGPIPYLSNGINVESPPSYYQMAILRNC